MVNSNIQGALGSYLRMTFFGGAVLFNFSHCGKRTEYTRLLLEEIIFRVYSRMGGFPIVKHLGRLFNDPLKSLMLHS
jgi:hypothetical protein